MHTSVIDRDLLITIREGEITVAVRKYEDTSVLDPKNGTLIQNWSIGK